MPGGGGSRIRPTKKTKNAFRPVPVRKSTFPVTRYTPLKDRVTPDFPPSVGVFCREEKRREIGLKGKGGVALEVPEASQEKFLPKMDRATQRCSSYARTKHATLCHYEPDARNSLHLQHKE